MKDINQRLQGYRSILRDAALKAKTFEAALGSANLYGCLNFHNQDGLLSDDDLEAALFNRYQADLAAGAGSSKEGAGTGVLHVATETYDSGGHSRLLERLLQIHTAQGDRATVLITRAVAPIFAKRCRSLNVDIVSARGSLSGRCLSLISTGMGFAHIFLHIHPDDIGAALAARFLRHRGKKVYFVNHADDRFSFGSGAAGTVCEISGYGWRLTASGRTHNAQHFLGIPISKLGTWMPKRSSPGKTVLSIGQSYKYKPIQALNFPEMAARVISRTGCSFMIVGSDGKEPWWANARRLHPDGFLFVKGLRHDALANLLGEASCYVDSFPVTGGTAFTEAVYFGVPSFGLNNIPIGYSIADSIRLDTIEMMENSLISCLLNEELPYDANKLAGLDRQACLAFGDQGSLERGPPRQV